MIGKATMLKCVLLDANIIIEEYELDVWKNLLVKIKLIVPSIVVHDEALFFSKGQIPQPIDLKRLITAGQIAEVTATSQEMVDVREIFDNVFVHGLDDGELEALALINAGRAGEALFCTGDAPAIRALAMIGHPESGISMESLLRKTGLVKPLQKQFGEAFFRAVLTEGKKNLITGQGMNPKRHSS